MYSQEILRLYPDAIFCTPERAEAVALERLQKRGCTQHVYQDAIYQTWVSDLKRDSPYLQRCFTPPSTMASL